MTFDVVQLDRDLRRRGETRRFDWLKWLIFAALFAFSFYVYRWEYGNPKSDLFIHAQIAGAFNFADLHSITSRLAYPLWHLCVAALFQLGLPLGLAAAAVTALSKGLLFLLVWRYLWVLSRDELSATATTVIALILMFVTPVRIAAFNPQIYHGVGSPTVWHNPTELAVLVTAMLCVPYTAHCWYDFEARLPQTGAQTTLPWRKVITLAALMMASLACKPTFMQALIPAAAAFFLTQWIRHPKNSRYFGQIILAFLPAVAYFLLQYLYYTGVVVPYSSGVEFGATWADAWEAVRNMLLMAAFPLLALLMAPRTDKRGDAFVALALWMAAFSVLEAMFFRETGLRLNHGNFSWASMSSAFMLWVAAMPKFIHAVADFRESRRQTRIAQNNGALSSDALQKAQLRLGLRSAAFLACCTLLVWHVYSGVYYLYYLFSTGNTF